jgi:hypothetical protein
MSTIQNIEQKNFLATEDDVERMAREFRDAQVLGRGTAGTYLKILLAAIQAVLLGKPVLRAPRGPSPVMTDEAIAEQREALEATNTRLYAAVLRGAVTPDIADSEGLRPEEARRRALERNRRTNYARSAVSTLRAYLRSGGDLRRVAVPSASKGALAAQAANPSREPVSPEDAARRSVQRVTGRLTGVIENIAQEDRKLATQALQLAMDEVSQLLLKYGGAPVTKIEQAVTQHRLLRTPEGVFWPTAGRVEHRTQ